MPPQRRTRANNQSRISQMIVKEIRRSLRKSVSVGFADAWSVLARFSAVLVSAANQQGGNGVLEDELFLGVCLKHDGILIKRTHVA